MIAIPASGLAEARVLLMWDGTQALEPSSASLLGALAGSWIRRGTLRIQASSSRWNASIVGSGLISALRLTSRNIYTFTYRKGTRTKQGEGSICRQGERPGTDLCFITQSSLQIGCSLFKMPMMFLYRTRENNLKINMEAQRTPSNDECNHEQKGQA